MTHNPEAARLREALDELLPSKLCGESWNLPDTEKVTIVTTIGAIKQARAALQSQPSEANAELAVEQAIAEVNERFPEWKPTPAMLGYARAVMAATAAALRTGLSSDNQEKG